MATNNPITGSNELQQQQKTDAEADLPLLKLRRLRGFSGKVLKGLCVHPGGEHLVYAIGQNIIIEENKRGRDGHMEILSKHSCHVSCLACSPDGRYIASGERVTGAATNVRADVILWNFNTHEALMQMKSHKVAVLALGFSVDSHTFTTIGDEADSKVMVWSVIQRQPKFSKDAQMIKDTATKCLGMSKRDPNMFMTAGCAHGRLWRANPIAETLEHTELNFAKYRKDVNAIEFADMDCIAIQMAFLATRNGEILIFSLTNVSLQAIVPKKSIPHGLTCLTFVKMMDGNTFSFLAGTGDGKLKNYHIKLDRGTGKSWQAHAALAPGTNTWSYLNESRAITSIDLVGAGLAFFVGTADNNIYEFDLQRWTSRLHRTNSSNTVWTLAFPRGTDDLLVTGEHENVRVINLQQNVECRRFFRANRTCHAVVVNHDGTLIFTGWDNGETLVLGFDKGCQALKELWRVDKAQKQAVTALALSSDSTVLVTGGADSQVRVWRLVDDNAAVTGKRLREALLMHTLIFGVAAINDLEVTKDDLRVLVSSQDGCTVVYMLDTGAKVCAIKWDQSQYGACFCSNDLQILTVSRDGILRYWEVSDGDLVRQVESSRGMATHTVCLRPGATDHMQQVAATAGKDALVKLWDLGKGEVTHVGRGHSDDVIKSRFGPCGSILVSSGRDGSLCIWEVPELSL